MKKIIKLTESDLSRIVRRVINETKLISSPYVLEAINGDIKITDNKTKKSYTYGFEIKQLGFWVGVDIVDFPNGNSIKASGLGITKTISVDKEKIKNIISKNWGKATITFNIDGYDLRFVKI